MNTFYKRFLIILMLYIGCTFFTFSDSDKQKSRSRKTSSASLTEKQSETFPVVSSSTEAVRTADHVEKKSAEKKKAVLYSSIQDNSLMLGDGNRWYYEGFDSHGRVVFTVLYENDKELERMTRRYESSVSVYPIDQIIIEDETKEITQYTPSGKVLRLEKYGKDKKMIERTENRYDSNDNLVEQIYTKGGTIKKSVWNFAHDKVVAQTKYRNGEKTALIEMKNDKRIVHIYKNDREVFVTEDK